MKNVLFATSALVSVAGVALADGHTGVSLSGSAEMGITYTDISVGGVGSDDNAQFHNSIDVTFTLSGETENGMTFGASVDLDESETGELNTKNSVFISGSYGTLTMGDTDTAYDKVHIEMPAGGLNDEADVMSGGSDQDGLAPEVLRYDYSFGDFTVSGSIGLKNQGKLLFGFYDQDTDGNAKSVGCGLGACFLDDNVYAIGGAYSGDLGSVTLDAGLGYIFTSDVNGDDWTALGLSAKVGFGDFAVQGSYQMVEIASNDVDVIGVALTYTSGPIGFAAAYELTDVSGGGEVDKYQGYVTYDLTGGAELVGAASYQDFGGGDEITQAGFGLSLSF